MHASWKLEKILTFSEGNWKVWVVTNGHTSASTQAQVTITVYGHKGNSGPISLGSGDGSHFQSGNTDDFEARELNDVLNKNIIKCLCY